MRRIIAISLAALSACVPASDTSQTPATDDSCGAMKVQSYVGKPVESFDFNAHYSNLRIIPHDAVVTTDYQPDRLNVTLRPDRVIDQISCG